MRPQATTIPSDEAGAGAPARPPVTAIILAAGQSVRFGSDKLAVLIDGLPVWRKSLEAFLTHDQVDAVVLVAPVGRTQEFSSQVPPEVAVVKGGSSRRESSARGLASVRGDGIVLIHDAARPYVSHELISRVIEAANEFAAVVPGLSVTDTIKQAEQSRWQTLDRSGLMAVQTPQASRANLLRRAHSECADDATDDMSMLEAIGVVPHIVDGDPANRKITYPEDVVPSGISETRVGFGYDIHAFSTDPDRPLWLGGIEFDDRPGLDGHSDADVLIHAVVDALLGAAALGDIGQHYPNSDPRWKNAPSGRFLSDARGLLSEAGWHIINVDLCVIAERPKIMARSQEIRARLADLMQVDVEKVSVKATTNERLGALGRGEGIAAMATCSIARR